jgi:molecular chaperone Hsp33
MIGPSRLYSFLDRNYGFSLYFLDAQLLIHDLVLREKLQTQAFQYYRDNLCGFIHIINFLKPSEGVGIYIDSDLPYFRFKIEANWQGLYRTLLLPEDFNQFPEKVTGALRMSKIITGGKQPYNSILKIENEKSTELFNHLLETSYQVKAKCLISNISDQSLLINKLPPTQIDRELPDSDLSLEGYILQYNKSFNEIFAQGLNEVSTVVEAFEKLGLNYLSSKEIRFKCSCSKESMMFHIAALNQNDLEHVFSEEKIDVKCDYCKTQYDISQAEFKQFIERDLQ